MRILKADTVVDRLCDVCEKSLYLNIGGDTDPNRVAKAIR